MLRQWHPPCALSLLEDEISGEADGEMDEDVIRWDPRTETAGTPMINEDLTTDQQEELCGLLSEFNDVLRNEPGRTNTAEYRIRTKAAPIRLPPYPLPHTYRDTVKKELKEMEEDGIIEQSESEWAFPIVLVRKKDGTLRMCVDYRRLNTAAEADAYPMPRVDDRIDCLGKSKYVTTLDLARGYWQVPVEKESRPLTAFATPVRAVRVMLFRAPATFQRMMDSVVRECYPSAAAYLDDVVIHSANWEDHTCQIRRVLQKLQDAGLTVKPKKCQLAMSRCTYLGHVVGQPEQSKLEAVKDYPTPTLKKTSEDLPGSNWVLPQDYPSLRRPRSHPY